MRETRDYPPREREREREREIIINLHFCGGEITTCLVCRSRCAWPGKKGDNRAGRRKAREEGGRMGPAEGKTMIVTSAHKRHHQSETKC